MHYALKSSPKQSPQQLLPTLIASRTQPPQLVPPILLAGPEPQRQSSQRAGSAVAPAVAPAAPAEAAPVLGPC